MTRNVYICGIGEHPEPATEALHSGIPVDKAYILNNKDASGEYLESERKVREFFEEYGVDHEVVYVKIYDFNDIVHSIMRLDMSENERFGDVRFHINFTSGTRIMSGAMVYASMMVDAELCYVYDMNKNPLMTADEQTIKIQPANLVDLKNLTPAQKDVFMEVGESSDGKPNKDLVKPNRAKSTLATYTGALEEMNLIKAQLNGREKTWTLTEKGRSTYSIMCRSKIKTEHNRKGMRKTRVVRRG